MLASLVAFNEYKTIHCQSVGYSPSSFVHLVKYAGKLFLTQPLLDMTLENF